MGAVLFGAFLVFVGALAVSLWILFAFASWLAGRFVPKRPHPASPPAIDIDDLTQRLVELERRAHQLQTGRHLKAIE